MSTPKPTSAIITLLQRYFTVIKHVWSVRQSLDSPPYSKDELAFLPAQLELIETPVSAAPRWTARLIMAFALLTLLWAVLGQVDIVAVAQGKTSTQDKVKTIQPIETAQVISIDVYEGQYVKQGDTLATLTQAGIDSDVNKSHDSQMALYLSILRDEALLKAITSHTPPIIDPNLFNHTAINMKNMTPPSRQQEQEIQNLVMAQYQNFILKNEQLNAGLEQLGHEIHAIHLHIHQLEQSLALEQQKLHDYQSLLHLEAVAKHDHHAQKSKVLALENEFTQLIAKQKQLQSRQQEIKKQQQLIYAELKETTLKNLRQSYDALMLAHADLQKTKQRQQMMTLNAPIDGYVQELAIHTIGGVVTPAQTLMVITPKDEPLEVEALILNKDIGFLHVGQPAKIKLETYPYTRYGYLTGTVKHLSLESIAHEQLGQVYTAIIALDKKTLSVNDHKDKDNNQSIKLTSGMNATIEIKTGKRRVIDYLLSPLQTKIDESMKER